MIPLGMPHDFGKSKPMSQTGAAHNAQAKMQLENRLRIKKLEARARGERLHELEREMTRLESEIEYARGQVRRVEGETRGVVVGTKKEENLSRQAGEGVHEADEALRTKRDKEAKIKHEIDLLKREIGTKEHALGLLHEEESHLMQEKEGYRRQHEMGHFTAKAGGEHAHEKELEAGRFKREEERKTEELARKKGERDRVKQEILMKEEEIRTLESGLRRLG